MQKKDEQLMQAIFDYVNKFYRDNSKSPSIRTIAAGVDTGKNTVQRYLVEMNKRGTLIYDGKTIRTPQSELIDKDTKAAGLIGHVSCGVPTLEEENIEAFIQLPTHIFGEGELYLLTANGDSMIGAGIENGDLVVVRKTTEAQEGDIIVALVDDETTLKRFYYDGNRRQIRLHPENPRYSDIYLDSCEIQGVATHVIKALENNEYMRLRRR